MKNENYMEVPKDIKSKNTLWFTTHYFFFQVWSHHLTKTPVLHVYCSIIYNSLNLRVHQ
jgi:hypothetical protein